MIAPIIAETSLNSLPYAEQTSQRRSIPSLDGLRAISISLVVLAHYTMAFDKPAFWNGYIFQMSQLGVNTFFVISGFLITLLLCKEQAKNTTISLRSFYHRRAWRIFPPFYVYLTVVAFLSRIGIVHLSAKEIITDGLFLGNYCLPTHVSVLGHTWTLALEEQFYLLWPFCLNRLKRARAIKAALLLLVLEPLIRVAEYALITQLRASGNIAATFHTRIDTLMFGCLVALLWRNERFVTILHRFIKRPTFYGAVVFLFCIEPLLNIYFRSIYHAFWFTCDGAAISIVLVYLVRHPLTIGGRLMNLRPMRYVGRLSYSLYLWQQLFVDLGQRWFPLNLLAAIGCACLSMYLVEQPSLRLRNRFMHPRPARA